MSRFYGVFVVDCRAAVEGGCGLSSGRHMRVFDLLLSL